MRPDHLLATYSYHLNDERSEEYREFALGTISALEEKKRRLRDTIGRIERLSASSPEHAEELDKERTSAKKVISKVNQYLTRFGGRAGGN